MRTVPLATLLQQMIAALEQDMAPALPAGYLRSQALALASILHNLADRVEERCELLQQENRELRETLLAVAGLLGPSAGHREPLEAINASTGEENPQPAQANLKLKEALVAVIQALPSLGLSRDKEAEAERLVRRQLRGQLNRDLALRRPTHFGRLSTGG